MLLSNKKIYSLLFMLLPFFIMAGNAKKVVITKNTPIYTSAKPGDPLYKAVESLKRDLEKTLGKGTEIKSLSQINEPGIVIVNSNKSKLFNTVSGWEAHHLYLAKMKNQQQIILEGADMRGTIFAIYTFSEKIVGVPPFWYFSEWKPAKKKKITVSNNFNINVKSPQVKYRAWFPNDTDLFAPWRKLSKDNSEMWLEAALRCKINTMEWFDDERDYADKYSVSPTTKLIKEYGLVNTTHHHSPLNASFRGWGDYWKKTRGTVPPELSLANKKELYEFWRYNVECVHRNNINMLWVLDFRGNGDHPFWYTFKDAPKSMTARGKIINKMLKKQRDIVLDVTGDPDAQFRSIFYNELSDLLAKGYIHPPKDPSLIWTYVAARRDHYPNKDIQELKKSKNERLGYYFNYQFNSTGSHLAAAEGPWKMERNFRYVASKSNRPLAYSVVNAGNIREYVMELSANAKMMWDFDTYSTNSFLKQFSKLYYGKGVASKAAQLYHDYYYAYWKPKKADFENFDRQYIFPDLRYRRAIQSIAKQFDKGYNPNPLKDLGNEQVKGRTFRIVPEDNNASSQIGAIINGTSEASAKFLAVAKKADAMYKNLNSDKKPFFNDNLRAPAYFMYHLNECLLHLSQAYKMNHSKTASKKLVKTAIKDLKEAQKTLNTTAHGNFSRWYAGDSVFGFDRVFNSLKKIKQS